MDNIECTPQLDSTASPACIAQHNMGPAQTSVICCSTTLNHTEEVSTVNMTRQCGEDEQAAELEKCEQFVRATCGCKLADGKPCSSLFPLEYYADIRGQAFLLTRDQLDMVLLGSVASTVQDDDDVGVRSGHKPAKRQRTGIGYMHKGYNLCRTTFTFLYGVSKHKVHGIKKHFLEHGFSSRTHGNTNKRPHNALTFNGILNVLKFIQNYAEQNALLLPGRIPGFKNDDIKVLPSSDSKKVCKLKGMCQCTTVMFKTEPSSSFSQTKFHRNTIFA